MIDIKSKTAVLIKENLGLENDVTHALFDLGLLDEGICKRILIREEYLRKAPSKSKTDLKMFLADKYCVSFHTIEKYVLST